MCTLLFGRFFNWELGLWDEDGIECCHYIWHNNTLLLLQQRVTQPFMQPVRYAFVEKGTTVFINETSHKNRTAQLIIDILVATQRARTNNKNKMIMMMSQCDGGT